MPTRMNLTNVMTVQSCILTGSHVTLLFDNSAWSSCIKLASVDVACSKSPQSKPLANLPSLEIGELVTWPTLKTY